MSWILGELSLQMHQSFYLSFFLCLLHRRVLRGCETTQTMSAFVNNSSVAPSFDPPGNQPDYLVRMVFTWTIIAVGSIGNSFIVAVIIIFRHMRTTTNYLLVNVAVADITTLLFTAMHLIPTKGPFPGGALGSFLCKFVYTNNITMVTLLVTTLTLTLLAVERYHAMIKPLVISRRINTERIAYVVVGIWMVAIAMVTPLFVSVDHRPKSQICSPGDNFDAMKVYIYCLVVMLTLIPFFAIAFCYSRIISGLYFGNTICSRGQDITTPQEMAEKKKIVILLIALTTVFFVAYVPYGVALILQFSGMANTSVEKLRIFNRFKIGVQYLTLLNCSMNPFIYAIPSTNYRCCFKYIFKKILCQNIREEFDASELRGRRDTI